MRLIHYRDTVHHACALLILMAGLAPFATQAGTNGVSGVKRLAPLLEPIKERHQLPALAAALVTSEGLQSIDAIGVRKSGSSELVTTNDLWHLGSDTKVMTATVVARFVERGQLRWDTTIGEVFPKLAVSLNRDFTNVTMVQLLSHRAGLAANLPWSSISQKQEIRKQRLQAVKDGMSGKPKHRPDTEFLYSNLGYVIAGAMLEQVAKKPWEDVIRTELFNPLGMTSAGFGGLGTRGTIDQPWGHTAPTKPVKSNGAEVDNPPVLGPAGRVHCTLPDWAKFISDQLRGLRGESALLKQSSYEKLATPPAGGEYALGWGVMERPWAGGAALNHCGCNTMFFANAWLAPKRNFAILVCSNVGEEGFAATDEAVLALLPNAVLAGRGPRPQPLNSGIQLRPRE